MLGAALVLAGAWLAGCAAPPPPDPPAAEVVRAEDRPVRIPNCYSGQIANYLVSGAQQCWFQAEHGRWRTLSHNLHYDLLLVRVAAENLEDASEIAGRFVEVHGERFSEIVIYVAEDVPESVRIRRVTWTRHAGFEHLDFDA